ncbi:MAG: hypothetical protein ACFFC7_08645 [Candidatus Hermodarchaeota archaeon]
MRIKTIYIFLKDGRCVVSKSFDGDSETTQDPDYFCPLFAAIDSFAQVMTQKKMKRAELGDLRVFTVDFEDFNVLVTVETMGSLKEAEIEDILETIGIKFLERHYRDLHDWDGDLNRFLGFDKFCERVINTRQGMDEVQPTKIADAITLLELDSSLKKTLQTLIEIREGTVQEIMEKSKIASQEEQTKILLELVKKGYVGKRKERKRVLYYTG